MLTIFAIPKRMTGQDAVAQRNAIGSWLRLRPECQIILLGDDPGVAEVAEELGIEHVPGIEVNDFGTPLLSSAFAEAELRARFPTLCYVNADIILLSDLLATVRRVKQKLERFLVAGRRWDLEVDGPLPFEQQDWEEEVRRRVERHGKLHPQSGSDYFVYPKGLLGPLPGFAVGRGGWDNWVLSRAVDLGFDMVDATDGTTVVHQNHGYEHVRERSGHAWEGTETDRNRALLDDLDAPVTLEAATYRFRGARLVRKSRIATLGKGSRRG